MTEASTPTTPTLSTGTSITTGRAWWETAVVYQIYPRSFADSDGDGVGDLAGITSRVPYLRQLGVDAVWLSPFYPSALADGGYDVDDYRDVDPRLGTLAGFDAMVEALQAAELKVMVDVVPNHTSNRHPWFLEALAAAPGSAARDRYVFLDGLGTDQNEPPNDWESLFGGSCWQPVGDGQWYLHLFAAEQPDLNWRNAEVQADFEHTLRFWADRGVDGFRIDVAHGLVKDLTEPHLPWSEISEMLRPDGSHPLWDRDDVHEIYARWRAIFDSYDPPRIAVAEASVHPRRRSRYAARDSLGMAFTFEMQDADWRASDYRGVIDSGLIDARSGDTATWLLGCHDAPRPATRYGLPLMSDRNAQTVAREWLLTDGAEPPLDRELGERRARAAVLILFALPGSTYVYQGEELGLQEVAELAAADLQDPMAFRSHGKEKGRDGCRVPLPWTVSPREGSSFGFGPAGAVPPQPAWFADYAVATEEAESGSTLNLYRSALRLRRQLITGSITSSSSGSNTGADFGWIPDSAEDVLHFVRPGGWHCLANFGAAPVDLPDGEVLLSSAELVDGRLPGDASVWVRSAAR